MGALSPESCPPAAGFGRGCSGVGWATWATAPVVTSPATGGAVGHTQAVVRIKAYTLNPKP